MPAANHQRVVPEKARIGENVAAISVVNVKTLFELETMPTPWGYSNRKRVSAQS